MRVGKIDHHRGNKDVGILRWETTKPPRQNGDDMKLVRSKERPTHEPRKRQA